MVAFFLSPLVLTYRVFEGDLHLGDSSYIFYLLDIFSQPTILNQPFDDNLQLDAIVNVVVVILMEKTILRFVKVRCFPNGVMMTDSSLQNLIVGGVLVNLFASDGQMGVLVIPLLYTMIKFTLASRELLSGRETRVGFD